MDPKDSLSVSTSYIRNLVDQFITVVPRNSRRQHSAIQEEQDCLPPIFPPASRGRGGSWGGKRGAGRRTVTDISRLEWWSSGHEADTIFLMVLMPLFWNWVSSNSPWLARPWRERIVVHSDLRKGNIVLIANVDHNLIIKANTVNGNFVSQRKCKCVHNYLVSGPQCWC